MTTKLFVQICLYLYDTRPRVALVYVISIMMRALDIVTTGNVVVRLCWSKEFLLFQSRRELEIADWMSLALKFLFD